MVSPSSLGNALDVFFAAPLDANLTQTNCLGLRLHRGPLRHVFGDAEPRRFNLRRNLGIGLAALRELLAFELQQRQAFLLDAVLELVFLLGDVLEPLFGELERMCVRLDADLDRPAGLVGVDVVQREVGRIGR